MYAEVLVEYPNKAIDKTFTYLIPQSMISILKRGMQVSIPFNNRLIKGIVLNIKNSYQADYDLKEIANIINPEIYLNDELLALGNFLSEKTLCPQILAYQTMFPSALKIKKQTHNYNKMLSYVSISLPKNIIMKYISDNQNNKGQIRILEQLLKEDYVLKSALSSSSLKILLAKNLVKITLKQEYRLKNIEHELIEEPILSAEQSNAIAQIDLQNNNVYLLYGVTGSGKTEVYIRLMKEVLLKHKACLLILPEITLTSQIINRFYERFSSKIAIFHSALSNGEKYDEYLKIYRGDIEIVIGTRSAIFTPLTNIGLIIIDEEQSDTYHQEDNPRYNAIEMAKFRAKYNNCPLILGSATPTLESMARAKKGVYKLLSMPHRINNNLLPQVKLVDMSQEMKKRRMIISELLEQKINDRLQKHEQIILLLNRRGYSSIVTCQNCGYTFKCPHCDITLTFHKSSNNLRCHYCGYTLTLPDKCPDCQEDSLNYLGLGTEKLEANLQKMFPSAHIIRMDMDTTQRKNSHESIIAAFKNHDYDILLGTQMISKGLDFPLVTLVGVISADSSLNIPDFRSGERTFDLLYQVSGRAGRATIPGEVIIQTFNKDNAYLKFVANYSYDNFYEYEMNFRHELKYPPYYYLVSLKISGSDYQLVGIEANKIIKYLRSKLLKTTYIFGPTPAPIFKLKNNYRYQILIKYQFDSLLNLTLKELDAIYAFNKNVNLAVDLDPLYF